MSHRVLLRREAQDDLGDAANWYEEQRRGLGGAFLDQSLEALERIGANPLALPVVHQSLRRSLMRRFPFAIYYRIEPDVVSVVAIMHGSRSPTAWKVRT